jgi:hypothetical protein
MMSTTATHVFGEEECDAATSPMTNAPTTPIMSVMPSAPT